MTKYFLPTDYSRCLGYESPGTGEMNPDCLNCLRFLAPWGEYRQSVMCQTEDFDPGECDYFIDKDSDNW